MTHGKKDVPASTFWHQGYLISEFGDERIVHFVYLSTAEKVCARAMLNGFAVELVEIVDGDFTTYGYRKVEEKAAPQGDSAKIRYRNRSGVVHGG